MKPETILACVSALHETGGFTLDPSRGLLMPKFDKGYVVGLHPHLGVAVEGKATAHEVGYFVEKSAQLMGLGLCVGGWYNAANGRTYLDLCTVCETEAEARQLAKSHGQIAYFCLDNGVTYDVA